MYVYTFIMINHFPSVVWMHAMINVSTSQGRYSFVGNLNFHILAANQLCVFIHCTQRFAADWHQTNKELWKYTKTVWLNSECQTLTRCKFCVFHFALLMNIALHRSLRCHTFKKFSITVFFSVHKGQLCILSYLDLHDSICGWFMESSRLQKLCLCNLLHLSLQKTALRWAQGKHSAVK